MFEKKDKTNWRDGVYLMTAENSLHADIIESKLRSEAIPFIRREKGAGNAMDIIMGSNFAFPIDIYVPPECLEDAQNVILPVEIDDDFDESADEAKSE